MKANRVLSRIVACMIILTLFSSGVLVGYGMGRRDNQQVAESKVVTEEYPLIHDEEFGGSFFEITIDDFNKKYDIEYGDSVDIIYSNGTKFTDVPYYNGYYVKTGEVLMVAYPGYPYMRVGINNGDDIWHLHHLDNNMTLHVELREKAKYLDIQKARDIHYLDDREKFESDVVFANFRNVTAGNIKEGRLYRSASPCDNQHNRAPFVDKLISEANIDFILNLADNESKIEGYLAKDDFNSPYFKSLYDAKKYVAIAARTNYQSSEFKEKLGYGLQTMLLSDGPYLIHCTEGKDRTGFVLALLEAACGATYDEIVDDYMITYKNYYGIDEKDSRYNTIVNEVLADLIESFTNDEVTDFKKADLEQHAKNYLLECGLSYEQVEELIYKLTN